MRIAFASCCSIQAQRKQEVWKRIQDKNPDLLILLGDNVYMGGGTFSESLLHKRYQRQSEEKHFMKIMDEVKYLATWDDHDFGENNSHGDSPAGRQYRDASRELFHCYLKDKSICPGRPEVYCSFVKGNVKFIVLDTRYYRQPPGSTATLLGASQERWLRKELKHKGRFTIICSGSCFSAGGEFSGERWIDYPGWETQFRKDLKEAPHPVFLTGNIHRNELVVHTEIFPGIYGRFKRPYSLIKKRMKVNFFEVISSGVARPTGILDGHREYRDNYGIMDISSDEIKIKFYGIRESARFEAAIDVNTWKLK